jgi:hypothetical protein
VVSVIAGVRFAATNLFEDAALRPDLPAAELEELTRRPVGGDGGRIG